MRKGLYLVAAFLMGGATLTLNSCIDTTEPTGIEAMRSAKAEYLKALAEFRSAKAALELIEVEKAKLELELKRLEHEADKYEAMAAAQEAMYAYYLSVANAEKEYLEAAIKIKMAMINMKDEVVAEELIQYEEKLTEAMEELNAVRQKLAKAEITKYIFDKDKEFFVEYTELALVEKAQEIEILDAYIAKLEEIAKIDVTDTANLEKQVVEAKQALKALDNEEIEKMRAILKKKQYTETDAREIAKLEKEIYDEEAKKKNTSTLTIKKNDIGDLIIDEFNEILESFNENVIYNNAYDSQMQSNIADIYDNDGDLVGNYTLQGIQLNEYEEVIEVLINNCKKALKSFTNNHYETEDGYTETITAWNALIVKLEYQVTNVKNEIKAIDDNIANKRKAINNVKEKYNEKLWWADELECFMIKGSSKVNVDGTEYTVFSANNPYKTIANLGNIATRGRALQETIAQLEYAIQNKSYSSFLCYDETTDKVITVTDLQELSASKKNDLLKAKAEKVDIEATLEAVNKNGVIIFKTEEHYEFEINDAIAYAKREVAAYERIVEVYRTTIEKIIEAYESGELFSDSLLDKDEKPSTGESAESAK